MMRIFGWSDLGEPMFRPPPLVVKEEGTVLEFHDHPMVYGMEVGDSIHYRTGLSVVIFRVTEVRPAELKNYSPELKLVTARKKE
jgi:hypothetical protein